MRHPVIIDPEFRSLIPPMSADSLAQLEDNIRTHGCLDALIVYDNWSNAEPSQVLLDGHNRYDICTRRNIPFETKQIDMPSRDLAKLWILQNQIGRRNLTREQRLQIGTQIVLLRQQISAQVKQQNLKKGDQAPEVGKLPTSGKSVSAVAKEVGVGEKALQAAVTTIKDSQPKPTRCDVCDQKFKSKGLMKDHRRKQHADVTPPRVAPVAASAAPTELTQTFYVMRRKLDGGMYGGRRGVLQPKVFEDDPAIILYYTHRFDEEEKRAHKPLDDDWEWVRVEAKYQLTAVPSATQSGRAV